MKSDDLLYALTRAAREVGLHPSPRASDPDYWEKIARSQAVDLESQRIVNAELIRERYQALADRDAAFDLACQYCRRAGIEDSAVPGYVADFRDRWASTQEAVSLLEGQRCDTLGLAHDLKSVALGERSVKGATDLRSLAEVISAELVRMHTAQGPKKRSAELFGPPTAPVVDALFSVGERL